MRQKILNALKHNLDWVSGEVLCRELGVSRTAVWKHISSLREDGYRIEAKANLGYRLTGSPDVPFPAEVMTGLTTSVFGCNLVHMEEVASTNAEAKKLAREGCPEGTVIIAEAQNGGKGRLGRTWFSPWSRGLWFSLVLRPPVNLIDTPQITMVAAVSVATAIREYTGVAAGIKWPNDILVDGKKVCGILVELNAEMDRVNFMVAGVGLNVNIKKDEFPPELAAMATSLGIESGQHIYRVPLLRSLLQHFESWYYRWLNEGFAIILKNWRQMCVTLDCPVTVHTVKESYSGYAFDVDDTGALLVRTEDGAVQRLVAGEVTLRKQS